MVLPNVQRLCRTEDICKSCSIREDVLDLQSSSMTMFQGVCHQPRSECQHPDVLRSSRNFFIKPQLRCQRIPQMKELIGAALGPEMRAYFVEWRIAAMSDALNLTVLEFPIKPDP